MMIANATGCSSIYGGSCPSTPYRVNAKGQGPAWGNSLFEDNAEYGLGMFLGVRQMRDRIERFMTEAMAAGATGDVAEAFKAWIENKNNGEKSREVSDKVEAVLSGRSEAWAKDIMNLKQYLVKTSQWVFGGDGWAYDIGYGGLDHVLASGEDVNVLVVDTEVYSNTGGQASKSTPVAAIAKFAASGKRIRKKDLGLMAASYGYVYVAQVSMGANQAHYYNVLKEAEAYPVLHLSLLMLLVSTMVSDRVWVKLSLKLNRLLSADTGTFGDTILFLKKKERILSVLIQKNLIGQNSRALSAEKFVIHLSRKNSLMSLKNYSKRVKRMLNGDLQLTNVLPNRNGNSGLKSIKRLTFGSAFFVYCPHFALADSDYLNHKFYLTGFCLL